MLQRLTIALAAVLALVASLLVHTLPAQADTGFRVSDGRLVDAAGNDFVMRGVSHPHAWYAQEVFDADPHANTVFSIHMYGVYEQESAVVDYLESFTDAGLPLVVGEFGHLHSDGDPDEDAVMFHSERLGLGYIGWSWSGNSGGADYLDRVHGFDATSLTPWGERIFHGPDGIAATPVEAPVYS